MARSAASKAAAAADTLETFLRDRLRAAAAAVEQGPDEPTRDRPAAAGVLGNGLAVPATRRTRPMDPAGPTSAAVAAPLRLPHTEWLRHRLLVTGPAAGVAAFRHAAAGAGTIPWRLDLDSLQEDWCHLLVSPAGRELSLAGARVLARQLRDAVEHRHAVAVARVGHTRACPLDLHALVPVPADILHLGPDHPQPLGWLWQHWGTTQALRHVASEKAVGKAPVGEQPEGAGDGLRLIFWSADWTPWRAFQRLWVEWPELRFNVQPDYAAS